MRQYNQVQQTKKKNLRRNIFKPKKVFLFCSTIVFFAVFSFCVRLNAKSNSLKVFEKGYTNILKEKSYISSVSEIETAINSKSENKTIDTNAWNLLLVNSTHFLPENFKVELTKVNDSHCVDSRIYDDLTKMLNDAKAIGLSPIICSSYRTMEKQTSLFNNEVSSYISSGCSQQEAEKEAGRWVAIPGTSEHQTGLAVDIVASSYQILDKKQEQTAEQKWLMEHCAEYGFILRYPTDKSEITKIGYEPWHYRYVGKDIAKEIMEKGICLEEYLEEI